MSECTSKNIPAEFLEEMVWNDIVNFINNPEEVLDKIGHKVENKKCEKENLQKEKEILTNILKDR